VKSSKNLPVKRMGKQERERQVLLGLVDYFIHTGKPVGSNTLKEAGFGDLSSATIRNYFANLEEGGFLSQSHSSSGRVPTPLAFRTYANFYEGEQEKENEEIFKHLKKFEAREIAAFLQGAAEELSLHTNCAVFLGAPRFDHDFISQIKLVPLDAFRCLGVILTDFGVIQTEIIHLPAKLSVIALKRIEQYFYWRLTGMDKPDLLEPQEEAAAQIFYNEIVLRYIVGYSNFIDEDLYRTGFSRLLTYSDFQSTSLLASGLSLFENGHSMRLLLKECKSMNKIKFWIGEDLSAISSSDPNCSVIAVPYYINSRPVGAVGLLGPNRLPYRSLFQTLRQFSRCVSEVLTRNIYKFKIQYRQPEEGPLSLQKEEHASLMLLEDKSKNELSQGEK